MFPMFLNTLIISPFNQKKLHVNSSKNKQFCRSLTLLIKCVFSGPIYQYHFTMPWTKTPIKMSDRFPSLRNITRKFIQHFSKPIGHNSFKTANLGRGASRRVRREELPTKPRRRQCSGSPSPGSDTAQFPATTSSPDWSGGGGGGGGGAERGGGGMDTWSGQE